MPAVNPRLTITLKPAVHAAMRELSRVTGNSQSALIGELLEQSLPVFERMVQVLQAAQRLKAEGMQAKDEIGRSLDRAQERIEAQLGLALDDMEEGFRPVLEQAEKVERRRARTVSGGAAADSGRGGRRAATPLSNRGVRSPLSKSIKGKKGGL